MSTKLLIPLLNKNVVTYKGPTWYLFKNISVENISMEDSGLLYSNLDSVYHHMISSYTKCIIIDDVDPNNTFDISRNEGSKIGFLLNYFKEFRPVILSFAVQITKKRKAKIDRIIDLGLSADLHNKTKDKYKIKNSIGRDLVTQFYEVINTVSLKYPSILLAFDRFNSSLYRKEPHDKIIDITISLESLLRGKDELSYRFALYNAWASDDDPNKREENFALLKNLYNARSELVHGTPMTEKEYTKKIEPVIGQWDKIIRITKQILGYYVLYLYSNKIDEWYEHQKRLALNAEKRLKF